MSSSYTRPCKYCNRTIQLRNMPAGQWVAFEGDEVHKCLSNHSINKTGFTKNAPENTNKKSKSDIYSDLDFFEVNVSSQPNANTNASAINLTTQASYTEANRLTAKDLPMQILDVIRKSREPLRAKEIAKILNKQGHMVDKTMVNQCLYGSLKNLVYQDSNYCWAAYLKTTIENTVTNGFITNSTSTELIKDVISDFDQKCYILANNDVDNNDIKKEEKHNEHVKENIANTETKENKYDIMLKPVDANSKKGIDNNCSITTKSEMSSQSPKLIPKETKPIETLNISYVNYQNKNAQLNHTNYQNLIKQEKQDPPKILVIVIVIIVMWLIGYFVYGIIMWS